ncbi:DUF7261 family protein [Halomicrobium urmianum]|uniref:DUF7261 family protein n=1 Tax=Halomicrobium urmianum TaxID=1586233 RepID=UPI001CDA3668|nr:hypothetical protein [Halomicrobium urmianum]
MAHLNGDRGQILLVAALALAAVFVLLTVVVNSAIFTENLASRGETVGSDEALALRAAVVDNVGETVAYANRHNNSDYDALARNVTAETANVSAALSRHYVADGVVVEVTGPNEFANGTRIVDENESGSTFAGADGSVANWTVATDVDGVRAYRLNVSNGSVSTFGSDDAFSLTVENDTAEWRANFTRKSGTFTVGVDGTSDDGTCQVAGSPEYVRVDLTEGTVAGEPCAPLQFARDVSSPYDVSYRNGDAVSGNYSLVVNESGHSNDNLTDTAGTDDPYVHDAVYSADVRYRYDGPQLHYETNVTVAPGEPE